MAITIKVRRGKQAALPTLAEGELGYTTDERRLYIGSSDGNTEVATKPMAGATASVAGKTGLVPAPAKNQQESFLRGDGTWQALPSAGTSAKGVVQLSTSTSSTSTDTAATPSAVKAAYDKAAGKNRRTTLYTNAAGLNKTSMSETFMTADPSLYDYFIVSTNRGTIPVYRSAASQGYISGGTVISTGSNSVYIISVCFSVNNDTTGSKNWILYDNVQLLYDGTTWTSGKNAGGITIYKIEGVTLG